MSHIVTISPKGQITIPASERVKFKNFKKFQLEVNGVSIIIKPVKIAVIENGDELDNFHLLADSSFDFWNDPDEDVYDNFYKSKNDSG